MSLKSYLALAVTSILSLTVMMGCRRGTTSIPSRVIRKSLEVNQSSAQKQEKSPTLKNNEKRFPELERKTMNDDELKKFNQQQQEFKEKIRQQQEESRERLQEQLHNKNRIKLDRNSP